MHVGGLAFYVAAPRSFPLLSSYVFLPAIIAKCLLVHVCRCLVYLCCYGALARRNKVFGGDGATLCSGWEEKLKLKMVTVMAQTTTRDPVAATWDLVAVFSSFLNDFFLIGRLCIGLGVGE